MPETEISQSAAILGSNFIALVMVKGRHIVWANRAMHRLFGYEPDELIGQPTRKLFLDQASYEEFGRQVYAVIADSRTYCGEHAQKRKDGSIGWFEFNISTLEEHPDTAVGAIVDRTERHILAERLRASELRYRTVVEDQTEMIGRFLPDGTLTFVNDVYCRVFGKAAEELIGHAWQPVAHPDDLPMINARLRELSPDHPTVIIENRVFVAGGDLRWMQFVNRGFFDADGKLSETQSVGRDITVLKQAEAALKVTEATLNQAQAVARIGSFATGSDTEQFTYTKETARLFDLAEHGETSFGEWFSRVHPDDQAAVEAAWRAALQGAPYDMTYRIVVRGQVVWIRALAELSFDALGQLICAIGTVQDISDLKRIESDLREHENELQRSKQQLELAVEASGLGAWEVDLRTGHVARDRNFLGMLGYAEGELEPDYESFRKLAHPDDLAAVEAAASAHFRGETEAYESEHRLRHREGHYVWVFSSGKVVERDADGNPFRIMGTNRNITQHKRLSRESIDLMRHIEQLIAQLGKESSVAGLAPSATNPAADLTKRQRQILGMIASGMTSAQIGKQLRVATSTVVSHRRSLMAKLDLHTTAEVTRFAIEHGLTRPA